MKTGDKVKMTKIAINNSIHTLSKNWTKTGIVSSVSRDKCCINVILDGMKTAKRYHVSFWKVIK